MIRSSSSMIRTSSSHTRGLLSCRRGEHCLLVAEAQQDLVGHAPPTAVAAVVALCLVVDVHGSTGLALAEPDVDVVQPVPVEQVADVRDLLGHYVVGPTFLRPGVDGVQPCRENLQVIARGV